MRWLLFLIAVGAGCGRIGFEDTTSGSGSMVDADVLVTRDGVVVQPSTWTVATVSPATTNALWAVQASSPTDIWVGGVGGYIAHFTGTAWTSTPSGQQNNVFVFWAASPSDLWLSGAGCTLLRWQGASWTGMTVNGCTGQKSLESVDGSSTTNVWTVGDNGNLFSYNGSTWTNRYQGNYTFWSVAVRSPTDVLLSGDSGTIMRWNGSQFTMESAPNETLTAIAKVSSTESWIVGSNGVALHSMTPGTWTTVSTPVTSGTLYGVYAAAPNDIWAVGAGGVIIHYDGTAWSQVQSPTTTTLRHITGIPGGGLIAVGDSGVVLTHP
jgi:hypothetical protein